MPRSVFCQKLQKDSEGLERPPYPGDMGKRIYESISKDAWEQWINHQTILINEYHLNMLDQEARKFLATEMEKFLFGEGSEKPDAFVAPSE